MMTLSTPRTLAAGLIGMLMLASAGVVRADQQQKLAADGVVHRVAVEHHQGGGVGGSFDLLYRVQQPTGWTSTSIISCTDDARPDIEPSIDLNPQTQQPILVWSRGEAEDMDVFVSVFDGAKWAPCQLALGLPGDDVEPRIRVAGQRIHIIARNIGTGGPDSFWRVTLDRQSLAVVFGPEELPRWDTNPVSLAGGADADPSDVPPRDQTIFAQGIDVGNPSSGRVALWGVRDEPVPVGFHQEFVLPAVVQNVDDPRAGWVGDRFALWFTAGNRFVYSVLDGTTWSELRLINLDGTTPPAGARQQMVEMLLRVDKDLPE